MDQRSANQTTGLIALMVLVTGVVAFCSLHAARPPAPAPLQIKDGPSTVAQPRALAAIPQQSRTTPETPTALPDIIVDVSGAVNRPGVYRLAAGSRINDAIIAAGGAGADADTTDLHLAQALQDGAHVLVPHAKADADSPAAPRTSRSGDSGQDGAAAGDDTSPGDQASPPQTQRPRKLTDPSQGAVNINTADEDELQRLPGVGPTLAKRIIEYRQENNGFKSPDELKDVTGIGTKKFAKLVPFIRVN